MTIKPGSLSLPGYVILLFGDDHRFKEFRVSSTLFLTRSFNSVWISSMLSVIIFSDMVHSSLVDFVWLLNFTLWFEPCPFIYLNLRNLLYFISAQTDSEVLTAFLLSKVGMFLDVFEGIEFELLVVLFRLT